ncbi:MAG: hypothetical protein KDA32_15110, partial [Phycisphaerales bacterium]|nr:hypothetical protein [Phycisphaerales bacterium]
MERAPKSAPHVSNDGSSDDFRRAEHVFQSACDLPAAERAAFVRKVCAGDTLLESEVRSLLDNWESA